jgi:hypothetical protein
MTLRNQFINFRSRARVISPKIALLEDTITGKKIGQNVGIGGLLSADVHQGVGWRSSVLQMPASMSNCYYYLFVKYVPPLHYNLHDIFLAVF